MTRTTIRRLVLSLILIVSSRPVAAERPNIVVILTDDMGYSDIACYGGEIETPNLDRLAAGGVRFTQFYNTGRCCPTRASLLTGLYPHQAGVGWMVTEDNQAPGYRGNLNRNCATIGEVLRPAGYSTYAVGKWHVTPPFENLENIDKDNWPLQRGFDRYFGTIMGGGSFFDPANLVRDNDPIAPPDAENFYYTDAISDHAVRFINDHDADKPLFMYVAYTAAHWPMHAKPNDIAKYQGRYDAGWDEMRKARYERMLELGVIDSSAKLSPNVKDWSATENQQWEADGMEVYAAMVDCMDQGVGRIVAALEEKGQLDNTLILYLQDNGGCQEQFYKTPERGTVGSAEPAPPMGPDDLQFRLFPTHARDGRPVRIGRGTTPGPADTYMMYGIEWANLSNTPFRLFKHFVHEGGISTPLIAHWPVGIKRHGELEPQPGHLIDIMATCVDLAGADYPQQGPGGQEIHPAEGVSLVPAFRGESLGRESPIFWEHEGNRAVRQGDWKLVSRANREKIGRWQLYNLAEDRSEMNNLAAAHPEKVQELAAKWRAWAERANVLPLTPYWRKDETAAAAD